MGNPRDATSLLWAGASEASNVNLEQLHGSRSGSLSHAAIEASFKPLVSLSLLTFPKYLFPNLLTIASSLKAPWLLDFIRSEGELVDTLETA